MGVGNGGGVPAVGGSVAVHLRFFEGIDDLLARLILGQALEGPGPVVISGDSLGGDDVAVGQQVDGDGLGTDAVLVIPVVPVLGTGNAGHIGSIGVGDGVADGAILSNSIAIGSYVISRHVGFHNGVHDGRAVILELGQLGPLGGPVVAFIQGNSLAQLLAVSHQLHGDACGTLAILVVVVFPNLRDVDGDLGGLVGVGDIHAVDGGGVAFHLALGDGVVDFNAMIAILGQLGEAPGPAVFLGDFDGLNDLFVSQQVDGDGLGTLAVLVVTVLPGLGAVEADRYGIVAVGDGHKAVRVSGDFGGIAAHLILGNGIGDQLAVLILIQAGEAPGPVVGGGDGGSQAGGLDGAILAYLLHQVDGDAFRTETILVIVVVPGLLTGDAGLARCVGVGHVHTAVLGGVVFHSRLAHGVGDLLAVGILGQVLEGPGPAVFLGHSDGSAHLRAAGQQGDRDALGALAVLVVFIVPGLGAAHSDVLNLVRVGHIVALHLGGVVLHLILGDGVVNELAAGILIQLLELPAPVVGSLHFLAGHFLAVGSQADGDALGTEASKVITVIPGLGAFDIDLLGDVAVGQGGHGAGLLSLGQRVALGQGFFRPGVVNGNAAGIHGQVVERGLPAVLLVQHNAAAVGQVHRQAGGTLAILVFSVVPDLLHGSGSGFGSVAVGQGGHSAGLLSLGQRVAVGQGLFRPGVLDLGAVIAVLGQTIHSNGPAVLLVQGHFAVVGQGDLQAGRTLVILVVRVVPNLLHGSGSGLGGVAVGQGGHGAGLLSLGQRVALGQSFFRPGVLDLDAVIAVLGQILHSDGPAVLLVQGHFAVVGQGDLQLVRTLAILVVSVAPDLLHGSRGGLRHVSIGDLGGVAVVSNGVLEAFGQDFTHGVDDVLAAGLLLQAGEAPGPGVAGAGEFLHSSRRTVGQQFQFDAGGTDAVLVTVISPDLGTGEAGLLGLVAVGDHIAGLLVAGNRGRVILRHLDFGHRVNDVLAAGHLVQVSPGMVPAVALAQGHSLALGNAVGVQLHLDALGLDAVLVALVVPGLADRDSGGGGIGAVDDVVAAYGGGVAFHCDLVDGVLLLNALHILGQVIEGPAPVVISANVLPGHLIAIGQQNDGNALGTLAVLVVLVIPGLAAGNNGGERRVGIGDSVAFRNRAGDLGGVVGHSLLSHGVDNLLAHGAGLVLGQVVEAPLPFGSGVGDGRLDLLATGQQVDGHIGGLLAILVVVVVPDLHAGDVHGLQVMRVGNGEADFAGCFVGSHLGFGGVFFLVHAGFFNGVDDLHAAFELGLLAEGPAPAVAGAVDGHFVNLGRLLAHLLVQGDGDFLGTDAVAVAVVNPGLRAIDGNNGRFMGVGDGDGVAHLIIGSFIAINSGFHEGVVNLLASLVLVKAGEAPLPLVRRAHGHDLIGRFAVGVQGNGDAAGTDAVLIFSVSPDLLAGDVHRLGGVGIDDPVAIVGGGVLRHSSLFDGVNDFLAVLELIQIGKVAAPVIRGRHGPGFNDLAVGLQGNGDARRTLAVLVVAILPILGHKHIGLAGIVGVGNGGHSTLGFVAGHAVAFGQSFLRPGIDDRSTVCELGQALYRGSPVVLLVQGHNSLVSVVQGHLQFFGTEAVVVVFVVPDLDHGRLSLLGRMGIGDHVDVLLLAGDLGRVAVHIILRNGVDDLGAVLVHVKAGPGALPGVVSAQALGGIRNLSAVSQQAYGHVLGADAVLVVGVFPLLGDGDVHGLGLVAIGDGQAILGHGSLVAGGHSIRIQLFLHGVDNHLAASTQGQVAPGVGPGIAVAAEGNSSAAGHAVSQQLEGDALRTLAVLVVSIVPDLGGGHFGGVRIAMVGHDEASLHVASDNRLVVVCNSILGYGVGDLLAFRLILGQVGEGVIPVGSVGGSLSAGFRSGDVVHGLPQLEGDALRTLAILVVAILPILGHGDFDRCRLMDIGDHIAVRLIAGDVGLIARRHIDFVHGVVNSLAVGVLVQVGPGVSPAIGLVQGNVAHNTAVGLQLHGYAVGTDAVLVVGVVPFLAYLDRSRIRRMGVGDDHLAVHHILGRGIARHGLFRDRIADLGAIGVLVQVSEAPSPTVLLGGGEGINHLARLEQVDGYAFGTDLIPVRIIVPGLDALDGDLLGVMLVGDGEAILGIAGDGLLVALRYFSLIHGVFDLAAIGIHRQVFPGIGPAVALVQGNRIANGGAVSLQLHVHGSIGLTQAILVVVVIPNLGHLDLSRVGLVGVVDGDDNVVVLIGGGDVFGNVILVHVFFNHRVGNLLTGGVHGQVVPGVGPAVAVIQGNRRANIGAVSLQLNSHALGTDTILVVIVVPFLGHRDLRGSRLMGVGYNEAFGYAAGNGRCVARHLIFRHGIVDFRAGCVLGLLLELPVPVTILGGLNAAHSATIGHQVDHNAVRTDAILVIVVIPSLGTGNVNQFRLVGVGHVVAGHLGSVSGHFILGDGVNDLLAFLVLIKVVECPLPAVSSRHRLGFKHIAVSQQVDGDALGTLAVLVVIVVPGLGAFHLHLAGRIEVFNVIARHRGAVAGNGFFGNGVGDLLAGAVLGQASEAPGPLIRGGHILGIHLSAVSQQVDGDALRTLAVLVVIITPGLRAADHNGLRLVGINHVIAINTGFVVLHFILSNGINDFRTLILELGQALELPGPVLAHGGHSLAVNLDTVSQQVDGNALGALAVLVVIIIPGLAAGNINGRGRMAVGDGVALRSAAGHFIGIAFHTNGLGHGVSDGLAGVVNVQLRPGMLPAVIFAQDNSIATGSAVSIQLHRNGGFGIAQTILVVVIIPLLGDFHAGLFDLMSVGHNEASDRGGVVIHLILGDGVDDLVAAGILIQISEGILPLVARTVHGGGLQVFAVGIQVDRNGGRTLAILVAVIIPVFGDFHAGLFGLMGVGHFKAMDAGGVVIHRELLDGIGNLSTSRILGLILKGILPLSFRVGRYGSGSGLFIAGHQDDGDVCRTLAILVVVIVPMLGYGDINGFGGMLVGDGVVVLGSAGGNKLVMLGDELLAHGVDDGFTNLVGLVHGQIVEGELPIAVGVGRHNLARHLGTVGKQKHLNALRTLAILVASVVPDLRARDLHGIQFIGVGNGIAFSRAAGDHGGVTLHLIFRHSIGDQLAALVHRQTRPFDGLVLGVLGQGTIAHFLLFAALGLLVQADRDLVGALVVAVVVIVPNLGNLHRGLLGLIGVGNGKDIVGHLFHIGRIALGNGGLDHGVGNDLAALAYRQIAPGDLNTVGSDIGDGPGLNLGSLVVNSLLQGQDHGGTLAVLVLAVVPDLGRLDFGGVDVMGVAYIIAADNGVVAFHRILGNGVNDVLAHFAFPVLRQISKGPGPGAVGVGHHNGMILLHAISIETDGDALGTQAVAVAVVVPGLLTGNGNGRNIAAVGNGGRGAIPGDTLEGIDGILGQLFLNRIDDLAAVVVLIQVGEVVRPVGGSQLHAVDLHTVSQQVDLDLLRTDAVAVVLVIPVLDNLHIGLSGSIAVGQRRNGAFHLGVGQAVALGHGAFRPGVGDFLAAGVLGQVLHLGGPVVGRVQGNNRLRCVVQGHRQFGGTLAILVVLVEPDLRHGSFGLFGDMGIGDIVAILGVGSRVVLDFVFLYSIDDLNTLCASLVLRQAGEAVLPQILRSHILVIHFGVVSKQTHGDALRTLAILVASVVPGLRAGDLGGISDISIGNDSRVGIVGDDVVLTCNVNFFEGVDDLLALVVHVLVLGQAHEFPGPGAVFGFAYLNIINLHAVSQQVDGNALGTLAVAVVVIVPNLGTGNLRHLGRMGVGESDGAGFGIHGLAGFITRHSNFLHGVDDFNAFAIHVFELGQVVEAPLPVVRGGGSRGCNRSRTGTGKQLNGYAARTDAILVVAVHPCLGAGNLGFRGGMGVDHVVVGDFSPVVGHRIFGDGIGNLNILGAVLGQIIEAVAPCIALAGGDGSAALLHAISPQADSNRIGTQAVTVVAVHPGLGAGNVHGLDVVGVGDDVAFNALGIARRHVNFVHGVDDFHARFIHEQVIEGPRPGVAVAGEGLGRFNRLLSRAHLLVQGQGNAFGTQAFTIIVISPDLRAGNGGLIGRMRIGHDKPGISIAGHLSGIALVHAGFNHGILNLLAVFIHRQTIPGIAPAFTAQGYGRAVILSASQQLNSYVFRTDPVAVFAVVPLLGHRHAGRVDVALVGDGGNSASLRAAHELIAVLQRFFRPGVDDFLAVCVLGQVLHHGSPVVGCIQGNNRIGSVVQGHLQFGGTLAILVVLVEPDLLHGSFGLFGHMLIGNGGQSAFRHTANIGVALGQRVFRPGVDDFLAVCVLGQVLHHGSPVVGCIQGNNRIGSVVQGHLQFGGTLAILVVLVEPDLLHGSFGLFGHMLIGNGGQSAFRHTACIGVPLRQRFFRPGVGDFLAVSILGQVLHLGSPVVRLVQGNNRTVGQGHLQAGGTLAILVRRIVPDLLHGGFGDQRNVLIGHDKHAILVNGIADFIAFRHGMFLHGIENLNTAAILGQIFPFHDEVIRQGNRLALAVHEGFSAISANLLIQIQGYVGTLAILVVVVIPHLLGGDVNSFGRVAVGDVAADDGLGVAFRQGGGFINSIFNGLTSILGRQMLPDVAPGTIVGQFNCVAISLVTSIQLHSNLGRALAILVIAVIPDLGHLEAGFARRVAIGNNGIFAIGNVAGQAVAFRQLFFRPCILDQFAAGILGQTFHGGGPVLFSRQLDFSIIGELHLQAGGTHTILVVGIFPDLGHGSLGGFGVMGVGHSIIAAQTVVGIHIGNLRCVAFHRNFLQRIADRSAIGELGQIGPFHRPVLFGGQGFFLHHSTVSQQLHRHVIGTDAVLVVSVIPGLQHADGDGFGGIGVGSLEGVGVDLLNGGSIALLQIFLRQLLFHGIDDVDTFGLLDQIVPGVAPVAAGHNLSILHLTVGLQHIGDAGGSLAVLVIGVVPDLGHGDFHGFDGQQGIRDYKAVNCVAGHFAGIVFILIQFLKGIVNKLTFRISLIHLLPGKGPIILFLQRNHGTDQFTIGIQGNLHTFRTEASGVIIVIPHLGNGDIDFFLLQCIRESRGNITITINGGYVAGLNIAGGFLYFEPLILDRLEARSSRFFGNPLGILPFEVGNNALILRQTSNSCRPTVFFGQKASDTAVGQLNFQFVRTGAIRIMIVLPVLDYRGIHLFAVRICMELDVTVRHEEAITGNTRYLVILCCRITQIHSVYITIVRQAIVERIVEFHKPVLLVVLILNDVFAIDLICGQRLRHHRGFAVCSLINFCFADLFSINVVRNSKAGRLVEIVETIEIGILRIQHTAAAQQNERYIHVNKSAIPFDLGNSLLLMQFIAITRYMIILPHPERAVLEIADRIQLAMTGGEIGIGNQREIKRKLFAIIGVLVRDTSHGQVFPCIGIRLFVIFDIQVFIPEVRTERRDATVHIGQMVIVNGSTRQRLLAAVKHFYFF